MVGEYDTRLHFYRAVATPAAIDGIVALDFVLFVELIRPTSPAHSQSTPLVDADLIRPGGTGGTSDTVAPGPRSASWTRGSWSAVLPPSPTSI